MSQSAENAAQAASDAARTRRAGAILTVDLGAISANWRGLRDAGRALPCHQVLYYPVTDAPGQWPSYAENAAGYLLTHAAMDWFWNHYVRDAKDSKNPYVSPLLAKDLSGLPAAVVYTAEFDPLRDEGEAYAKRLKEAGVSVSHKRYDGQIHAFFQMGGVFPAAADAIQDAANHLKKAFA